MIVNCKGLMDKTAVIEGLDVPGGTLSDLNPNAHVHNNTVADQNQGEREAALHQRFGRHHVVCTRPAGEDAHAGWLEPK